MLVILKQFIQYTGVEPRKFV